MKNKEKCFHIFNWESFIEDEETWEIEESCQLCWEIQ